VVVLPVYGNVELAIDCLRSFAPEVKSKSDRVIVINDRGSESTQDDAALRHELSTYPKSFHLVTNPKNLGLVESLNAALGSVNVEDCDVLLVNSDASLEPGAVSEMRRILRRDEKTGIVCPRSDNASLATVPQLAGLSRTEASREFVRWSEREPESTIVPVAVGFCMVIRGELFREFGFFDTVFSPGYGEENDFSMRIRSGGWRVALANRALVFHVGGASFGRHTPAELQLENEIVFRRRYPSYTFLREWYLAGSTELLFDDRLVAKLRVFGRALLKQIMFTILGVAPQIGARLVITIRKRVRWLRK
jgi:GT2 family glycosyltransferase